MNTQRVNVYISGAGINCFYIEQYDEQVKTWLTIGDTYTKVEHANAIVEKHNLQNVLNELLKLKGQKS